MSITRKGEKPSNTSTVEYENLQPDDYEARLIYVCDLGLHENIYKGEKKADVQKLALCFEVLDNPVTIDGKEVPRTIWASPFNVYFSLTAKGKEIQLYNVFDSKAQEGDEADWDAVLGMPCSVTIENTPSRDGEVFYDNITNIVAIPKKYQKDISEAKTTDMCTGGDEDMDSPVIKALRGLAKWSFENRIDGGTGVSEYGVEEKAAPKKAAPKKAAGKSAPADSLEIDEDLIPFN